MVASISEAIWNKFKLSCAIDYYMKLYRQSSSPSQYISKKFKVSCQPPTAPWLRLNEHLHRTDQNVGLLTAIMDGKHDVVVKIAPITGIKHEYDIGFVLNGIPNYVRYYCYFTCPDSVARLFDEKIELDKAELCQTSGIPDVGILVMSYYPTGNMNSYKWDAHNLVVLKNIIKQVASAVLLGYQRHGFVHNDLHLSNVLLRPSKKTSINYDGVVLETCGLYAIIVDFERSLIDSSMSNYRYAYQAIRGVMDLACSMGSNSDLVLQYDNRALMMLISSNAVIDRDMHRKIHALIDDMRVLFNKSKN